LRLHTSHIGDQALAGLAGDHAPRDLARGLEVVLHCPTHRGGGAGLDRWTGPRDQLEDRRFVLDGGVQRRLILSRDGVLQAARQALHAGLYARSELGLGHESPLHVSERLILLDAHQQAHAQHREQSQHGGT
jgi:hypothetical protein